MDETTSFTIVLVAALIAVNVTEATPYGRGKRCELRGRET
jgi:hypothetical protein